jgi:hypothetical protein
MRGLTMKKPAILSLIIMCIGIATGKILSDWMLTIKICGIIGLIFLGIAGILNGSFVNGDRNRVNYSLDTAEDKVEKSKITNFVITVGLPNIILAIIVFFIINKN